MIVNVLENGWEVIFQRSHALLAAELAAAWAEDYRHHRWTETIVAIAQHDDQENYWEGTQHLSEIGAPLDFTQVSLETSEIQARTVIAKAYQQSLWVALLISQHNSFLYSEMRGQDKALDKFLDEQDENQKQWRKKLGLSKKEAESAYTPLRWADRLSLILAKRELPDKERALEIALGPDGEVTKVIQRTDGTITLEPWLFMADTMDFSIEARTLKQIGFKSEDSFHQAIDKAEIVKKSWQFVKVSQG